MLHRCYRNRCTLVTENDASLLLILMYSILPKMMYFSLPITSVEIFAEEADRAAEQKCGNEDRPADFLKPLGSKRVVS